MNKINRFKPLKQDKAKMETFVWENRIKTALKSKIPPDTRYLIRLGDKIQVYGDKKEIKWTI